jgi:uncharacterized protein (DUF2336 family)
MLVDAAAIPELEEVIRRCSPEWRVKTLKRITALFVAGASRFNGDHIRLFDQVFGWLIAEIEVEARAELSHRLAPLDQAPVEVVRRLAQDDAIAVAGPILQRSRQLAEVDLVEIARLKSQAHLLAISKRAPIGEAVTSTLIRRGEREVMRSVAENRGARLSDDSFCTLLQRAKSDAVLAEKVALRPDIPPPLLRDLLLAVTDLLRQRLLASARPETQSEVGPMQATGSSEVGATIGPPDYAAARRAIEALRREGKLDEANLVDFAKTGRYAETIATLSSLCAVPIEVVDRLMGAERPDPILILCKSVGWGWPIVRAVIMARPSGQGMSGQALDAAYADFDRLLPATAHRVTRFWQVRSPDRLPTLADE